MVEMVQARPQWFQRLLYCDVESKWENYHISTSPGQPLSKDSVWKMLRTCRKADYYYYYYYYYYLYHCLMLRTRTIAVPNKREMLH
jgi:hypothetical protein